MRESFRSRHDLQGKWVESTLSAFFAAPPFTAPRIHPYRDSHLKEKAFTTEITKGTKKF
jgi:hypothetical protein